jgi:hypothetical protein
MKTNTFLKLGLIGFAITLLITLVLYFTATISFSFMAPFYMPWMVFLLIGLTNKKSKK